MKALLFHLGVPNMTFVERWTCLFKNWYHLEQGLCDPLDRQQQDIKLFIVQQYLKNLSQIVQHLYAHRIKASNADIFMAAQGVYECSHCIHCSVCEPKQALWQGCYCLNLKINVHIDTQKGHPSSRMLNGKYFTVGSA